MKDLIPGVDYIGITTPFYCNDGKGKFVMHKRSKNTRDEHGTWDFGGGKVEFGAQLEESVLREVFEEYGVKGKIQEQVPPHSIIRTHNGKETHWLAIPFFVKVNLKKVINNEPHKIDEIGFFTLDTLPTPIHSGVEKSMKKYSEFFAKYHL
ncbi:MAG TPA: NUDIX hydrolase [Candidatus Levybacteria bacterium]|nr:NUDIX hydrolase [Candidatus Levybacteria bacterium]